VAGLLDNSSAAEFRSDEVGIRQVLDLLRRRIRVASGRDAELALRELDRLVRKWHGRAETSAGLRYVGKAGVSPSLLAKYDPMRGLTGPNGEFVLLDSMRNVDAESPVIVRRS
jgi:hypothetical protein